MGITGFERKLIAALKIKTGNNKIKGEDLMEWSTSEETVKKNSQPGELVFHLPEFGVWCNVKIS